MRPYIPSDLACANPSHQLESLISRLQRHQRKSNSASTTTTILSPSAFADLNKASDEELKAAKDRMSVEFEKRRLRPDDPNYVWDKQVDFKPQEPSDWDEEDDDTF